MNILETVTTDNQYFGMHKIDLRLYWAGIYANTPILNPDSFRDYADMRKYLTDADIEHHFSWINHGMYLPDFIYLPDDSATFFKLKYGI